MSMASRQEQLQTRVPVSNHQVPIGIDKRGAKKGDVPIKKLFVLLVYREYATGRPGKRFWPATVAVAPIAAKNWDQEYITDKRTLYEVLH